MAMFAVYLRLAGTIQEDSDMANILLMASDLLHGNLLLHGWHTSDVSFYTTELPQYALLESFFGPTWLTAHVAGAMTYTLAFLLALVLARGQVTGRRALTATLIVAGLMLAPGANSVFALLVAVGHIGTSVPLLAAFVLLDRAGRRWWAAPAVGLVLAWALIADPLVLIAGVVPIGIVAAWRLLGGLRRRELRRHELALFLSMVAATATAKVSERILAASGGYVAAPYRSTFQPLSALGANARSVLHSLLALFGADGSGLHGPALWFALMHLASVAVVMVGLGMAAYRFFSVSGLVDQVLLVAIAAIAGGAVVTIAAHNGPHEIAPIEPLAAALTARTLVIQARMSAAAPQEPATSSRSPRTRVLAGLVLVPGVLLLAGYLAALQFAASQPAQPPQYAQLATWLTAHGLKNGLADYWEASSVTVNSGGMVHVRPILPFAHEEPWMTNQAWYNPATSNANFLILDTWLNQPRRWTREVVIREFGRPARIYRAGTLTILVWHKNILSRLAR
jgi:hypothetical protein